MDRKNIEYNFHQALQTVQMNQQEQTHHFVNSNHKYQNKFPSNTLRNLLVLSLIIIVVLNLVGMVYYLNNRLQTVSNQIQQDRQEYLQINQIQKRNFKSFYTSWKNTQNNAKNLIKINKIKQLTETQKQYFNLNPKRKQAFPLAMNNYRLSYLNYTLEKEIDQLLQNQYDRMSTVYDFNLLQLPFCIIICTVNNSKDSRYQHNLRSILNQNYTNYKVVIIDDASKDENFFLIEQLVDQISPPQKIHLIQNKQNTGKLPNIYKAAHHYCQPEDIGFTVDGDDELLGVNVFKVFNHMYQKNSLSFAYSNAIRTWNDEKLVAGYGRSYSEAQKQNLNYRSTRGSNVFNLVSFKISNFRKIKVQDLKDDNGKWFKCAADEVMWPPLMELSCGKELFINEYLYLNYKGLGNQNMEVHPQCNQNVKQIIGKRPKYPCASQL